MYSDFQSIHIQNVNVSAEFLDMCKHALQDVLLPIMSMHTYLGELLFQQNKNRKNMHNPA
jgi:hypothetical protein